MRSGVQLQAIALEVLAGNLPAPAHMSKTSWTVHWEGPTISVADDSDDSARTAIAQLNASHIQRDWDPGGRYQGGSGIMYAVVIARSGLLVRTRDLDAVLWHSDNTAGNERSIPVLVLAAERDPADPGRDADATSAQLAALRSLVTDDAGAIVGPTGEPFGLFFHGEWTATSCPGPRVRDYVERLRAGVLEGVDPDMTNEQLGAILQKIDDQTDAIAIYIARSQRGIDVATGTPAPMLMSAAHDAWVSTDPAVKILGDRRAARAAGR